MVRRTTNVTTESFNTKIQWVKEKAGASATVNDSARRFRFAAAGSMCTRASRDLLEREPIISRRTEAVWRVL